MSKHILIVDIETTNFLQKGGKIVEIGIVKLDLDDGTRNIIFDNVMHERPMTRKEVEDSWIVNNSDLTVEAIKNSKQLKDYKAQIQFILNKYPLGCTAFNNAFDFGFMEDRGFKFPKKLPCPMHLSTNILKLPGKFGNYKWPKVQEAYDHFFGKTDYVELHRGADDALHEAAIVYELYLAGIFKID